MFNYGDAVSWLTVVKIVLVALAMFYVIHFLLRAVNEREPTKKNFIYAAIAGAIAILLTLGGFVFFGKGKQVYAAPAETDGHTKVLMAQPDPPAESVLDIKAEEKKNPNLKRMDEGPAKDQEEAAA